LFLRGYERPRELAKFLVATETVREIIDVETGVRDFTEDSHFIENMHLD
jgi:hypothetical protein